MHQRICLDCVRRSTRFCSSAAFRVEAALTLPSCCTMIRPLRPHSFLHAPGHARSLASSAPHSTFKPCFPLHPFKPFSPLLAKGGNAHTCTIFFGACGSSSSSEIEQESGLETARVLDDSTLSGQNERIVGKLETVPDSHGSNDNAVEVKLQIDEAYKFLSGGEICPHPSKASTGGEDAYFIEGLHWIGVADGVGGWMLDGINAGHYSRELMSNCALLVQEEQGVPNPKRLLVNSVRKTKAVGTCTAVVAALHNRTLYAVNIGDSGFLVIRNGSIVAESAPMTRDFNFPYQIGTGGDDPQMAEMYEVHLCKGDAVVLGTDGLYDNVYKTQIVDIIQSALQHQKSPEEAAAELVRLAHKVGATTKGRSPFADAAIATGYFHCGGKQDDVTVIVAYVH